MTALTSRSAALLALLLCLPIAPAGALGLDDLTNQEAARGIKAALTHGAAAAVDKLGVPGGFLDNPKVRIPLPPVLQEIAKPLRMLGRGKDADELETTMNRAAEQAVPQARGLLVTAVRTMT